MADLVIDDTIEAIVLPNGEELELGKTPTGNIDITQAGVTDVTNYATATVPSKGAWESYISSNYETVNSHRRWMPTVGIEIFSGQDGWIESGKYGERFYYNAIASGTSVTPTESSQTIGGANTMMEGAVTVNPIPSQYIVPSGTKSITSNGTGIDVAQYAAVDVAVPSGGGSGSAPKKQINFIDYDGTILHSYTKTEWASVTALPSNPSHDGLTAQGWNWTKAQIDAQLTAMPDGDVWVGQMYITTSGDTEIDVIFPDATRLSPILTIAVNGTITVDWGDNTTPDTVTGTSLTLRKAAPHTYASTGSYTIVIHVVSGSFSFYGSSSYLLLRKNTSSNESRVYSNCIQMARLGNGITSIANSALSGCSSLASITIPSRVTSIGNNAFQNCYSLASITIPSGVTSIASSALSSCYSLASITIPSGVTSIASSALSSCYSLASITIPSRVTSIGNNAFQNCYGVAEYHFKPTTVPALGTTAFNNIPSDCKIYVPSASLTAYQTATNWSTYASYMVGE